MQIFLSALLFLTGLVLVFVLLTWLLGVFLKSRHTYLRQMESRTLLRDLVSNPRPRPAEGISLQLRSDDLSTALSALDEELQVKYVVSAPTDKRRGWPRFEDWIESEDDPAVRDLPILIIPMGNVVKGFRQARGSPIRPEPLIPSRCLVISPPDEDGVRRVTPIAATPFCAKALEILRRALIEPA